MKTFKTPKGTELPFLGLRGKDYLQVAHRLVWFREEKPDFGIETEIISHNEEKTIAKAVIKDPSGRILADGYKQETARGFPDHLEKACTSAIGRALAILGYGTQFAQELEEEHRIVDGPLPSKKPPITEPKKPESNPDDAVKRSKAVGDAATKAGWDKTKEVIPYLRHRFGVDHPQYLTDDQAAEMILVLANLKFQDAMKGSVK